MIKRLFLFAFLLFAGLPFVANAQINMQNLHKVKVDDLSDAQVSEFVKKYTNAGYTLADVERVAVAKNMSSAELEKLKLRISGLETNVATAELIEAPVEINVSSNSVRKGSSSRVFGSSLFDSSKLSFEPSQTIATPRNYVVGVGDVLHVDVYGLSEATFDLTVNAEGNVRIPNVGMTKVGGLTIEASENLLKKKLSSVYSTISSGRTSVNLSVNKIRSIKVYILGEVNNPGSYTLTSVSTVFNALNACGGPSDNGSYRNIKLIRGGKEIASVDFYEFLLNGKMPSDVNLMDQDVIQVPPYENRITVNGAVKRDGIYELKSGETLQKLIAYCGGFTDDAYTDRIVVTRNLNGEKSVADVTKELFPMFVPASGDVYTIDKILEKYTNRVQIMGSVFRPGTYALDEGMSLRDLVTKANGLTEDAFMQSATLVRLQEDLTPEIISFNVKDLMDGNFNIQLQKEDIVTIGGRSEFERVKNISIYGDVLSPGVFPYYKNVTLRDIIFLSRGFSESADPSRIEVVRMIKDSTVLKENNEKTKVFCLSLDRELNGSDGDFRLEPGDQVTIRRMEGYENLGRVQILGEVKHPGTYTITRKTEMISDVMARTGGLTQYAYPEGAFLIRTQNRTEAEKRRDKQLVEMLKTADNVTTEADIRKELSEREDLVGIKLQKIIRHPGGQMDLMVESGDVIFVPREQQTVTVAGNVQVPGKVVYTGKHLRKYLREAGGFAQNAKKSGTYVAYSNGTVSSTRHFLWWKNYPDITPGAHIFVPEKIDKSSDGKANATFFVSLFSSIATMGSVVVTAISVVNKNKSSDK